MSKELHDGKGDEIFDSVEFTPASSKAIREAKKESRRLSKLQDRQEDDELARSRRESKLLFTNKQQEKQPTQA
ncbi:MAG: hypothetical protein HUJ68_06470 [Clostridia bacterium]|nr:hypothetical protein [Clostridia bacterium]